MSEKQAEKMDVLFGKVYLPTFMEKLASCGVAVTNEEDLQETLKIAAMLRVHQTQAVEQPKVSAIKQASARLEAMTYGPQNAVNAFLADPEVAAALV